ncbi:MAG: TIGR02281 family clan AA aspartic protease [Deltaproteobacteria bacterium]|nr:TIGR02281 family clan AA aspartic protease [Deltaproteobacteria bacterium]
MKSFCLAIAIALPLVWQVEYSYPAEILRWVDEKGVVHFTDSLHNIPENLRGNASRLKVRGSPPAQEPPKPIAREKATVPLQKRGAVMVVQAVVNDKAAAKFIIDTGASYTMISRATAKELQIDLHERLPALPFQTANGVITAPLVSLESINVGGMQVNNLTAAVHDVFTQPEISGLLGLNFLTHFRLDIDTQNGVLHLEKK